MSPKAADPSVRTALVETAARLLTDEGPSALTTRRLAREVGASTMAVYTHFGGMNELLSAISLEGFRRLARRMGRVKQTEDPVADVAKLGRAYRDNALANPSLYQVMFGTHPEEWVMEPADQAVTIGTFMTLVEGVQRCVDGGRFTTDDSWGMANQLWACVHGVVMLELSQFVAHPDAVRMAQAMLVNLSIGFGDDPDRARRSVEAAGGRARA